MSINKISFTQLAEAVGKELKIVKTNCTTCEHFTESTEICKLAGVRPPAKVIVVGCSSYVEEVPF